MADDKVAELETKLKEKMAENETLQEQVKKLKEELQKLLGEGGVDGLKDKLGKLACGSDDAEDGGEEKPTAEAAAGLAKSAMSSFF